MLITTTRPERAGAFLWPAPLFVWGPGAISTRHAHHCIQLVLALTCAVRVRQHSRQSWRRCGSVYVTTGRRSRDRRSSLHFVEDCPVGILREEGACILKGETRSSWCSCATGSSCSCATGSLCSRASGVPGSTSTGRFVSDSTRYAVEP